MSLEDDIQEIKRQSRHRGWTLSTVIRLWTDDGSLTPEQASLIERALSEDEASHD